jgi:hypothetical protein
MHGGRQIPQQSLKIFMKRVAIFYIRRLTGAELLPAMLNPNFISILI